MSPTRLLTRLLTRFLTRYPPAALGALLLAAASAHAGAAAAPDTARARYERERAACLSGQSSQGRETCLREAAAAFAESRRGGLDQSNADYARNQRLRCERLPGDDRTACLARMEGQGTVSGSVAGGGLLRELVVVEPAAPASAPR